MDKKWLDSIEKQGRRIDLHERYKHTNIHTYIHTNIQTYRQAGRRLDSAPIRKCRCHGNKGRPYNILHGCIESAVPENPLEGRNICGLSAVQVEL